MIGSWLTSKNRDTEAVVELQSIIRSGDAASSVYSSLGVTLLERTHDNAEAIRVLEAGRATFPDDIVLANNLAYAYLMAGQTATARKVLEALPPDAAKSELLLPATWGLLRLREGDFREGKQGYIQAAETGRAQHRDKLVREIQQKMRLELARFRLEAGDRVAAAREIDRGLALEDTNRYEQDLRALMKELS
jgi:Tetratricopeptide repeat